MKILLVEDEAKLAKAVEKGLRSEGMIVDVADNGLRGLEMALTGVHDAVVLDVMLPGMDGFEVLSRLRKGRCPVPVIMLTARSGVDDRVTGLDLGADDYLAKPFEFRELLARIRAVTRRPVVEPQQILTAADLELDPVRHEVRRAGKQITLTSKEFALLDYLLRRKGVVLSRTMILNHVWASDTDYDANSNLVEVYITLLRKKVDQGFEPRLIHTVRGAGYTLREPE